MSKLTKYQKQVQRLSRTRSIPRIASLADGKAAVAMLRKRPKKQGTRLRKATCRKCGYVVRVSASWVRDAGAPRCGVIKHGPMQVDIPEIEEGEE